MPTATINAPYPNRIVLQCDPLVGPFVSVSLGNFDCTRDVHVYLNGDPLTITSFTFDANNNRYLMYTQAPFLTGIQAVDELLVMQVVHHMPAPPFETQSNPVIQGQEFGQNPDIGGGA
jgi:hypothetical protein